MTTQEAIVECVCIVSMVAFCAFFIYQASK